MTRIIVRQVVSLATVLLLGSASILVAQPNPNQRPLPLNATGVLKGLRPGAVLVTTNDGKNWIVSVPKQVEQVVYTATASPEWLQVGMWVRFETTLDRQLSAHQEVAGLSVVTLREGISPGVFPESKPAGSEKLFTSPESSKKARADKKKAAKEVVTTRCLVIGRLLGRKGRQVSVAAGRQLVKATIAEQCQVDVQVNDLRLAQLGDQVDLSARYFQTMPGRAMGQRITIKAAKPLQALAKKGSSRRRRGSQTARPDKGGQATDAVTKAGVSGEK